MGSTDKQFVLPANFLTNKYLNMNERNFIENVYDILMCNTDYMTQHVFLKKYEDLDFSFWNLHEDGSFISISDGHNEWQLELRKTWSDTDTI